MAISKYRPHQKSAFIVATVTNRDARKHLVIADDIVQAINMVRSGDSSLTVVEAGSLQVDTIIFDTPVEGADMVGGPRKIITGN